MSNQNQHQQISLLISFEFNNLELIIPRDRIWGIGLGENSPDATNPYKWRGENLLGFALMEVRDSLSKA